LLADSFAEWFFGDLGLASVDPQVRFVFNGANLSTGVRFTFEREVVGDYVSGYVASAATRLRLADAIAASAALPGALAPLVLKDLGLPCEHGRTPKIVDGGAYDNMGVEVFDSLVRGELIVALNAGGLFRTGTRFGRIPFVRDLSRSNSLLYRQSTALRRRELVERFRAWEDGRKLNVEPPSWARRGVLFGLSTTFAEPNAEWAETRDARDDLRVPLALVKTTFARFAPETCHGLVYRGWWLAGAALATFHRDVLGPTLPPWRDFAH
jgi:NTE family protein